MIPIDSIDQISLRGWAAGRTTGAGSDLEAELSAPEPQKKAGEGWTKVQVQLPWRLEHLQLLLVAALLAA